ncbi:hypothetical protein QAD02_008537 [Eretmocerus hayati]|uniref:Uncharacterized protein n=1 Tax=Eretmocerus hayati TaxID=131215 RepID=A0ACC2N6R0_9HYME|nr:hypothetical protein QAD02_008537 [Eretmocerus hayati]
MSNIAKTKQGEALWRDFGAILRSEARGIDYPPVDTASAPTASSNSPCTPSGGNKREKSYPPSENDREERRTKRGDFRRSSVSGNMLTDSEIEWRKQQKHVRPKKEKKAETEGRWDQNATYAGSLKLMECKVDRAFTGGTSNKVRQTKSVGELIELQKIAKVAKVRQTVAFFLGEDVVVWELQQTVAVDICDIDLDTTKAKLAKAIQVPDGENEELNILVASVLLSYRQVAGNAEHHRVIIHVPYRVHTIHHTVVKHVIPPPPTLPPAIALPPVIPPIAGASPHKAKPDDWYELLGYSVGEPFDMSDPHYPIDHLFSSGEEDHLQYHLEEDQLKQQFPPNPDPFVNTPHAAHEPLLGARNDLAEDSDWTPSFGLGNFEGHPGTGHLPVEKHHPASGLLEMHEKQTSGFGTDFPGYETAYEPEVSITPVPQPWRQATSSSSPSSIRVPRQNLVPTGRAEREYSAHAAYAVHEQVDERL